MAKIGREYIDDLTDLYNRRYLRVQVTNKLKQSRRNRKPLSIVLIDIDHFKNVNDTYGHRRGDIVLKEVAVFLKTLLRQDDTVFRYGGDEFVCILPNANYQQSERISQRIMGTYRRKKFAQIRLTLSIGIASSPENAQDWRTLFDIADRNLYSAKRHGRNQIGMFEPEKRRLNIPTEEIIGRDSEITKINEFINPIFKESGGAVCISGEVGVGKTRLVHECVKSFELQNIQFLKSNLSATTKSIPYYPFREIIRAVINKGGKESITEIPWAYQIELIKIVPELSYKSNEVDENSLMLDKFRLFEGVRKVLTLQCSNRPLFVSLDNIHWADNGSLELLHYLARTLKNSSIFFFLIYRVEEAKDSDFQNVLQLMAREALYKEINLEPLETADVARMLSLILDYSPPLELTDYIFKETGGNPFFIEELLKSLETNDALIWDKDKWVFNESKKVIIPYSVDGVVDRKLSMMDSEACGLLEYAAVIGREFDFTFLQDITRMNEGHLFDLMDEILEMKLLKESGGEQYCFSEDIIREVIYHKISQVKIRRYHQMVGEKLLSLYKDRIEEIVEELSNHFYLSGDKEKAIEYSMIAADRAKVAYANQDAINFYSRVIEYLPQSKVEEKKIKEIECLRNQAAVLNLIGENEKAVVNLEKAIKKAKQIGNKKEEAGSFIAFCDIYLDTAQYNDALKKAKIALEIYQELNDRKGEAKSLTMIGGIHWNLGENTRALEFFQHSLKIVKEIGDRKGEADNLNDMGIIYRNLAKYSITLKFYQRSLEIKKEIGDRRGEAATLNNLGVVYSVLAKHSRALEYYQRALEIRKQIGDRRGEVSNLHNIGNVYYSFGEYHRALEFYRHSIKIKEEIDDPRGIATSLNNIGVIYSHLGEYTEALKFHHHSLRIAEDINNRYGKVDSLIEIGNTLVAKNDFSTAEKYYNKAHSIAQEIKSKPLLANASCGLISLHLEKNNFVTAKKELKQISSLVDELNLKELKAEVLCFSGRLYTKEKKWNKAKSSFQESISIFEKLKRKIELAQVYYYQGLMFKKSGDKTNAKKSFSKAMKIFEKLNTKTWIEKVTRGLGDKGTRRKRKF